MTCFLIKENLKRWDSIRKKNKSKPKKIWMKKPSQPCSTLIIAAFLWLQGDDNSATWTETHDDVALCQTETRYNWLKTKIWLDLGQILVDMGF